MRLRESRADRMPSAELRYARRPAPAAGRRLPRTYRSAGTREILGLAAMRRDKTLRAVFWLSLAASAALSGNAVLACNDNPLIEVPACRPGLCTCEEDPTQPTCKGFNDRPEGGKDPADATPVEASLEDTFVPNDAPDDAPDDAEEAGD